MNEIKEYTEKMFEDIKHVDENGNEYWEARELMPLLEYTLWQRFSNVIKKAIENCKNSNYNVLTILSVLIKWSILDQIQQEMY